MEEWKNGKIVLAAIIMVLALAAAWGQGASDTKDSPPQQRGFVFTVGGGAAQVSYGTYAESLLSSASAYGVDRLEISLDLGAGWALTQNLYGLGVVDAFATRFSDSYGSYMQINSYIFGGGLRWYPFSTGLVLGIDGGTSVMSIVSNVGASGTSPSGWGMAASVGYDFSGVPTGTSIIANVKVQYDLIDGSAVSAVSLGADVAWK